MDALSQALAKAPVIPVITITDLDQALPLAGALLEGGLKVLEITLRTDVALEAIRLISQTYPDVLVAAGTVLTPQDFDDAVEAGAKLVISPGATPELLAAATTSQIPFMPGVATASEAMIAASFGFSRLKFFPAEASGGVAALKGFAGPLANLHFCPTGGVSKANMKAYLGLPNVMAVGGSWMVPTDLIEQGRFEDITALAKDALAGATA
ncbi:MAG: bifunctional 4-hydroxy-2-oxoglutarate aldolase/2-dehydro-3-deoxy-phosphogluconate aldolase [Sphingomonadales bacterium]|jgi:2-dehydro-3-deoxyphosphogluconate aldolase/(4S)-4-hydroxy-2-oxoglutarate aldolase